MTYLRDAWYVADFGDEFDADRPLARTLLGEPLVDALSLHLTTPEAEGRCHYWFWTTRTFAIDPRTNEHMRALLEYAFPQQDRPVLEAQQRRIGGAESRSLKPVLLMGDGGSVRARRRLQQLIAAEGQRS